MGAGKSTADIGVIMDSISLQVQTSSAVPGGGSQTTVMDYANTAETIKLTTNRFDTPAQLSFDCLEESGIGIAEGSSVELMVDGIKMFKGYIFTVTHSRDGKVSYVARDQLRYLKADASYIFENMTLSQIIQRIAADFGLTVGVLEDTGYAFPYLDKENESCLDIIFDALSKTIIQTGKIYNFYDNAGALTLTEAKNMYSTVLIGDGSLVIDYSYKRDIDSDTYNRVKLVRKNSNTGRTDVYQHEDTETIKKWGLLQYYDEVDENLNEAQIDQMCAQYLKYYNRVLQTITIDAIGIPGIRAGMIIPVKISGIDSLSMSRLLIAEKVTHTFEGEDHTMNIEVKDFQQLGGMNIV